MEKLTREYLLEILLHWYANPENCKKKFAQRNALRALGSKTLGQLLFVVCDVYGISSHTLSQNSDVSAAKLGEFSRGLMIDEKESISLRKSIGAFLIKERNS